MAQLNKLKPTVVTSPEIKALEAERAECYEKMHEIASYMAGKKLPDSQLSIFTMQYSRCDDRVCKINIEISEIKYPKTKTETNVN